MSNIIINIWKDINRDQIDQPACFNHTSKSSSKLFDKSKNQESINYSTWSDIDPYYLSFYDGNGQGDGQNKKKTCKRLEWLKSP